MSRLYYHNRQQLFLWLALFALALTIACGKPANDFAPDGVPAVLPARTSPDCSDPSDGCPCESNEVAPCFSETPQTDGSLLCGQGERRCESGRFGVCRGLHTYRIRREGSALLEPGVCSACDPSCRAFRDRLVLNVSPAGAVLDPEVTVTTQGDLVGNPITNYVTLRPVSNLPPSLDDDGDCIPNNADCCRGPGFLRVDALASFQPAGAVCP